MERDHTGAPSLLEILKMVFARKGSVFGRALCFSLPCAIIAVVLKLLASDSASGLAPSLWIMTDSAAYSGFNVVLGFIFVFRTNMAYSRWWEGCSAGKSMHAEWFDAASTVLAFTQSSKASPEVTTNFMNQFVEYLSLLHGAAVATLRGDDLMDIITLEGLEESELLELESAAVPITLIFHWIQQLLVQHLDTGVLAVPPPIMSRAFQEFANGMVAFHDAERVQTTRFPFPYVQMTTLLLLAHWCITPIVMCMWTDQPVWTFIFTLLQVFIFWCLYFTAFEIEHPFKKGQNTYAAETVHDDFNVSLRQLLYAKTARQREGTKRTSVRFHMLHAGEANPVLTDQFVATQGNARRTRKQALAGDNSGRIETPKGVREWGERLVTQWPASPKRTDEPTQSGASPAVSADTLGAKLVKLESHASGLSAHSEGALELAWRDVQFLQAVHDGADALCGKPADLRADAPSASLTTSRGGVLAPRVADAPRVPLGEDGRQDAALAVLAEAAVETYFAVVGEERHLHELRLKV